MVASPIRDGAPIDSATSGHDSGQTPQQGSVDADRGRASLVTDDRVTGVKSELEDNHVGNKVQIIDDQLDYVNRSLSFQLCSTFLGSNLFTGNHLRDRFSRWLLPSDPSINHNITRNAHHNGTAQWFLVYIGNGNLLAPSCGYAENVRYS